MKSAIREWHGFPCPLTEVQQKKPFYVITAMLYLCNAIDEGHTFKEKLLALFKEYADVPIYKIGFFNRWEEEPIWKKMSE